MLPIRRTLDPQAPRTHLFLMLAAEPQPSTKPAPPVERWRNYYRVYQVLHLGRSGHWFPGIHAVPADFPTQAAAENFARAFVITVNPPGRCIMDFAGAYREDGRAN